MKRKITVPITSKLKVIWNVGIGKGSEIFREISHLFDFHMKAFYVHSCNMKIMPLKCAKVFVEFEVPTWS